MVLFLSNFESVYLLINKIAIIIRYTINNIGNNIAKNNREPIRIIQPKNDGNIIIDIITANIISIDIS